MKVPFNQNYGYIIMIDKGIKYLGYFTALILALLVLLVVYDATARYLFSTGSIALQELEWHLFDVVILLESLTL